MGTKKKTTKNDNEITAELDPPSPEKLAVTTDAPSTPPPPSEEPAFGEYEITPRDSPDAT